MRQVPQHRKRQLFGAAFFLRCAGVYVQSQGTAELAGVFRSSIVQGRQGPHGKHRDPGAPNTQHPAPSTQRPVWLFAPPAGAFLAVLDGDALGCELVANGVAALEVAISAGCGALGQQGFNLGVAQAALVKQ